MTFDLLDSNTSWALLPNTLAAATRSCNNLLVSQATRTTEQNQLYAVLRNGPKLEHSFATVLDEGVAILPVYGLIRPRPLTGFFSFFEASTNLQLLSHDLKLALASPQVKRIILDVDSPGGMLTGVAEFAQQVHDSRTIKPIVAYVSGMAASGAYWIASAADEVVVNDTAQVGGIGIATTIVDYSELEKRLGIKSVNLVSSQSPRKLYPDVQKRMDDLAQVFIRDVAQFRDVEEATVVKDFGRGDLLVGQRAVDAGLGDRIGTYHDAVAGSTATKHSKGVDMKSMNVQRNTQEAAEDAEADALITAAVAVVNDPSAIKMPLYEVSAEDVAADAIIATAAAEVNDHTHPDWLFDQMEPDVEADALIVAAAKSVNSLPPSTRLSQPRPPAASFEFESDPDADDLIEAAARSVNA